MESEAVGCVLTRKKVQMSIQLKIECTDAWGLNGHKRAAGIPESATVEHWCR